MEFCKKIYENSEVSSPWALASMVATYVSLVPAAALLIRGQYIKMQRLLLLVVVAMNLRYIIFGVGTAIAWFTNLYDIVVYLFLSETTNCDEKATLGRLPENTLLSMYSHHPGWANEFYMHFKGPNTDISRLCLHIHILGQTAALSMSFFHIFVVRAAAAKRLLGRLAALCGVVGMTMAVIIGSEDGEYETYGKMWSVYGWYWMAGSSFFCLGKGVLAVMRKDIKSHKRWMTRYYVSMWSDFLIFRLLLLVLTPMFTTCKSCALLTCIWLSPAIGLLLGQLVLSAGFEDTSSWTSAYKKN
mmetsp:Transcript_81657/g.100122  ORF Transcript_81657/g.100122 Transcript_81657/m.100122 type:complete len:300 (+) Transcript_81657:61-960(+)